MWSRLLYAGLLGLVAVGASCSPAPVRNAPNVVVILVDDQGYGDLGLHGNTMVRTPHLDRLGAESVRLTNFHVDPTCSPTRAALLTGRYSTRTGVWHTIRGRSLMNPNEVTLAEVFAAGGYRTGMVGKWHAHIDVLPTLAALCGLTIPGAGSIDGASLVPLLQNDPAALPERTLFVHSQRIDQPVKWRQAAVLTDRWRLLNGEALYDILDDPGQTRDVAAEQPEVVDTLRAAYEAWWASLVPVFDETVRIGIGSDAENPAELTSHDWRTEEEQLSVWAARQVFSGHEGNGFFALDVVRDGRYEIELRRWPRHMGLWIEASLARLQIGDTILEKTISPYDTRAVFTVDLAAGPTELKTWLGERRGAYFVYVRRLTNSSGA